MLDYNTCRRLKDAGFSQLTKEDFDYYSYKFIEWFDDDEIYFSSMECNVKDASEKNIQDSIKIPTLSELIEACGNDFSNLTNTGANWWEVNVGYPHSCCGGATPEEAVCNLWFLLNKKQ